MLPGNGVITLDDVTVKYSDSQPIIGLTLEMAAGTTAIVGPSGSGKSTLLRLMSGTQRPTLGRVLIDDVPVANASWRRAGDRRVAMIRQDYRLIPFLTVEQNLMLAAELRGITCRPKEFNDALGNVALDPSMGSRLPAQLSGGEQQRVAIARMLVTNASVILADEPTGSLDATNTRRVAEMLVDLAKSRGLTVVVATHDPAVANFMDRTVNLENLSDRGA